MAQLPAWHLHWEKNRPGENKATDMARVPPCAPAEPLADQSPGPTPVLGGVAEPAGQPTSPTLAPLSGTRDIPGARLTGKENHRHTDTSSHPRSRHSANICRAPTVCWPLGAAPIWKPHSYPSLLSEGGGRHTCSVMNEHFKCCGKWCQEIKAGQGTSAVLPPGPGGVRTQEWTTRSAGLCCGLSPCETQAWGLQGWQVW